MTRNPAVGSPAAIQVKPLAAGIGAEITGIDLAVELSAAERAVVQRAIDDHALILLRNQDITPPQQVRFSQSFGLPLRPSLFTDRRPPGIQELTVVSNVLRDGKPIGVMDAGALWHTDGSYLPQPDLYTVLYALEVPVRDGKVLGDTAFRNTQAAYEALAPDIQSRLQGLNAVHSLRHHADLRQRSNLRAAPVTGKVADVAPDVVHPVVRAHPATGKPCLFVTEGHTERIDGLAPEESAALLGALFEHLKRPEFMYRHQWRVGDLLVWDNCATQHLAITA